MAVVYHQYFILFNQNKHRHLKNGFTYLNVFTFIKHNQNQHDKIDIRTIGGIDYSFKPNK